MSKTLSKLGIGAIRIVLAIFLLVMCWYMRMPLYSYWHADGVYFTPQRVALFAAVLGAAFVLFCLLGRIPRLRAFLVHWQNGVVTVILLLLLAVQMFAAVFGTTPIGFDCGIVVDIAKHELQEIGPGHYIMGYPNNFMLVLLLRGWWKLTEGLFGDIWLASVVLNILFVDIAIFFTCRIGKMLAGTRGMYLSLGVSVLLMGLSPYILVPYSDTMSLPFVAGFVYFCLLVRHRPGIWRLVYSALAGFSLIFGYSIKPTVVIVGIAAAIVGFLYLMYAGVGWLRTCWKQLAACAVCFLLSLSVIWGMNAVKYSLHPKEVWEKYRCPMTHFMMMGLSGAGGYNADDVAFTAQFSGVEEKTAANLQEIRRRISQRLQENTLLSHLRYKTVQSFTDGTFTYGGEGGFHQDGSQQTEGPAGLVHKFTYVQSDFYRGWYCNYQQGLWLLIYLILVSWLVPWPRGSQPWIVPIMQLAILGLWIFLMMFECRGRYVVHFWPLFAALAAFRMAQFDRFFTERKKKS